MGERFVEGEKIEETNGCRPAATSPKNHHGQYSPRRFVLIKRVYLLPHVSSTRVKEQRGRGGKGSFQLRSELARATPRVRSSWDNFVKNGTKGVNKKGMRKERKKSTTPSGAENSGSKGGLRSNTHSVKRKRRPGGEQHIVRSGMTNPG